MGREPEPKKSQLELAIPARFRKLLPNLEPEPEPNLEFSNPSPSRDSQEEEDGEIFPFHREIVSTSIPCRFFLWKLDSCGK